MPNATGHRHVEPFALKRSERALEPCGNRRSSDAVDYTGPASTARNEPDGAERARVMDAAAFIAKPFGVRALLALIARLTDN